MLRFALLFWRVLASRAVRLLLYAWVVLWGLDRAIFWITESAWFVSVGQGAWFGARFGCELALFWGSLAAALLSGALAMRVAARPLPSDFQNATLPRALERLEPLRRGATRLAWLVILVGAWGVARELAHGWPLVLAARAGAGQGFEVAWQLPLLHTAAAALWHWLLVLLGATAFAGVLRSLPLLARREPAPPRALWRTLGALGALAMVVRGALYLLAIFESSAQDGTSAGELWGGLPLGVLGASACALAAFWCLRRPGFKRLGLAVAVAVLLPRVGAVLLSPLSLVLPVPQNLVARDAAATRAGWSLDEAPAIDRAAPPLAAHWPIWNAEALLGVALGEHHSYKTQVIDWRAAFHNGTLGTVVGVPAALDNWGSRHEAEAENALIWLALDAAQNDEGLAPEVVDAPSPLRSFYGIAGRPLAGNAPLDAGVPFGNWGWKIAWVWRLRDPLLLLDGARADRLLVFRGARESVEHLAPFLVWDEAQLRSFASGARWEVVGYGATPNFSGARALNAGPLTGFNAAAPAVRALIDPRNGRVEFVAAAPEIAAPGKRANWSAGWAKVLGARAGETRFGATFETPLLDSARAQMARQIGAAGVLAEPVWTWSGGRGRKLWRASNFPPGLEARLAVLDDRARAQWKSGEGQFLLLGDALLWPDARAPGGFWVGRPFYRVARVGGGVAREAKLWRVELTGIATNAPLATGDDARDALLDFDLERGGAPPLPGTTGDAGTATLAFEALRAHDAAQKAAANSRWNEWQKQSARERQLIEELAERRAK